MYCKQVVRRAAASIELSPEEDEAIRLALAGERSTVDARRMMRVGFLGPAGTY